MFEAIPTYVDLMYPTLQALRELDGKADHDAIDSRVIELANITDSQLSVVFPESGAQSGSKVVHRLAWARSYLKKLGAVETLERGIWALTPSGSKYLDLKDGDQLLRHHEHEMRIGKRPELFLKHVSERVESQGKHRITVRELLGEWEISRRGSAVIARIRRDLADVGLATDPPFEQVAIDEVIYLIHKPLSSNNDSVRDKRSATRTVTHSHDRELALSRLRSSFGGSR
ncbi:MAG TPA: winged helix-turn-helix domain-containing protein [Acidimicrobiia bacterium]|nr:winged helix-turn-helix domain-containing protein [Acidimicrobiia bacterium]